MTQRTAFRISALVGFIGVALGAFGAHALKGVLQQNQTMEIWEKAVFYHFIHAVMLFLLASQTKWSRGPWMAFLIGILVFSGSLYALAFTNLKWLGAITPIGGVSFMVGWMWLVLCPAQNKTARPE